MPKRYTTRQIMELTERRRALLIASAKKEQASLNYKSEDHIPLPEMPFTDTAVKKTDPEIKNAKIAENTQGAFPDGNLAADFFRQNPENTQEKTIRDVIEHQWNLAAKNIGLSQIQGTNTADAQDSEQKSFTQVSETVSIEEKQTTAPIRSKKRWQNIYVIVLIETILTVSMATLFFLMFHDFLGAGLNITVFEQGPFLFLIAVMCAWRERDWLQKSEKVSWLWIALCIGGSVIFSFAMTRGLLYLELTSLIVSVLAAFFGLYTAASARRLIFPLMYLAFVIPPPDSWAHAAAPWLNHAILQGGRFFLYILNIPNSVGGLNLSISNHELLLNGSLTGFNSAVAFTALAALYIYRQKTTTIGKWIAVLSIIPLVVLGNAVCIGLTGFLAFNYGFQYAQAFFLEGSGIVTFLCAFLGLAVLTAFFQEDKIA